MASGVASPPLTNFEFDEIEANDRLYRAADWFTDVNSAITPDLLGVNERIHDRDDAFQAALQAIDPELVKIYEAWIGRGFLWLRLPQPSKGTACPRSSSSGLSRLMCILEEVSRIYKLDFELSALRKKLARAFRARQRDDALSIRYE